MKEHPIPQDITSYRFHIVGSMTLKQFGEVALGVIIAFAIYSTNLYAIIKWPLMAIFFGGGLAAAFVPIEERPLSHWLATFFSILYKPTQFFWKRAYNIPAPFLYKSNSQHMAELQELDLTPARRQRIKEFLSTTQDRTPSDYSAEELTRMNSIMTIFQTQQVVITQQPEVTTSKPNLTLRVRSLRQLNLEPEEPAEVPHFATNSLDQSASYESTIDSTVLLQDDTPHYSSEKKNTYLKPEEVAQTLQIPENQAVKIEQQILEGQEAALELQQNIKPEDRAFMESEAMKLDADVATETAQFNIDLPFPSKPTIPNILVGMVLTADNQLIPGAIVEIKTPEGHVSRAVKTNPLGQFSITTPLANGEYVISVEKENYHFRSMGVMLNGKILDPIEIRSR